MSLAVLGAQECLDRPIHQTTGIIKASKPADSHSSLCRDSHKVVHSAPFLGMPVKAYVPCHG